MLLTQVQTLVNNALAGESLTLLEMLPFLDMTIDGINEKLNAKYPMFSELNYFDGTAAYTAFPDRYIRMVVVPGAAWRYYVTDEEGAATAIQYQQDYELGRFYMMRDMIYAVPEEYQADARQGYVTPPEDHLSLGDVGLNVPQLF